MPRRFPPPWSIEESSACFIVRDGDKQALAYVYFENEPGRRSTVSLVRRIGNGSVEPSPTVRFIAR
jgi:hypothetical protein